MPCLLLQWDLFDHSLPRRNPRRGRQHHYDWVTVRGDTFHIAALPVGSAMDPRVKQVETLPLTCIWSMVRGLVSSYTLAARMQARCCPDSLLRMQASVHNGRACNTAPRALDAPAAALFGRSSRSTDSISCCALATIGTLWLYNVTGTLEDGKNAFDALVSCFPQRSSACCAILSDA